MLGIGHVWSDWHAILLPASIHAAILLNFPSGLEDMASFVRRSPEYRGMCFTGSMTMDPHSESYLENVRERLRDRGLLDYLHRAVREVWRSNLDRHEPDELYDDALTLGLVSARNLANKTRAEVRASEGSTLAGVRVTLERNATVLHVDGVDVRMVKAPLKSGRHPSFDSDFRWTDTEGRRAAARRNFEAHRPDLELSLPLFETEPEDPAVTVTRCRDIFLVWGGELGSGLTAGWLGLPVPGPQRFLAVVSAWWDERPRSIEPVPEPATPADGMAFGNQPAPTPVISLKPRRAEGNAQ